MLEYSELKEGSYYVTDYLFYLILKKTDKELTFLCSDGIIETERKGSRGYNCKEIL